MHLRPAETDFFYQLSAYQLKQGKQKDLYILASNAVSMSFQSYAVQ